ncbi:efflux RND transporter permease subunit [Parasulfitobacter algicola]|uniref:Efflux RND transporter permease subunit n=1 Tax=Parasulfitobacter algicola TaxID=2614809 RepID=A0ABX2IR40_9RHOB|nr:efflux RND transporter permease subunit [Sulfitobacter algicola]NSX54990.1 efflux RND transporter permease subunit [Sulfitobacter algicola]
MARLIPPSTSGILSYFTRHKTAANLLLVLMIVLGLAAFPRMRAQFFPDVIIDQVTVSVAWDGAGAEDVDTAIIQVLEPALLSIEGVENAYSESREGFGSITLEFEPNWDMSRAADDVQVSVDATNNLPDEAEDPNVRRGAWRDRVTDVVITGPVGVDQLGRFADEFVTRLFNAGVTRTSIRGIAAPETVVEVTSDSLIRHNVTIAEIAEAIAGEADADPAGDVSGIDSRVRTGIAKRSADEIAAIVLRSDQDGRPLTVGDVAQVRVEGINRERAYFVGDDPAISIRVDRSDRGDAIDIQAQVQDVADTLALSLPQGVQIKLIRARAEQISGRLNILLDNALMGLGLVLALLFLFLNARTAFWVAAGIPVALLAAIALMYAAGLTINMVSLFALIITLGIVVDDAIVVGEHADFRSRRLGEPPVVAAENAAKRMAAPVFSATLTTVIAFFGLVAVGGRFGDLIADIPFTVIVVLIASLVECFLILPHHMQSALRVKPVIGFKPMRALLGLLGVQVLLIALGGLMWILVAMTILWFSQADVVFDILVSTSVFAFFFSAVPCAALVLYFLTPGEKRRVMWVYLSKHGIDSVSKIVNIGFSWFRDNAFRPLMGFVVIGRYPVMAAVIFLLAWNVSLLVGGDVQWRFFNAPERGSVTGNFAMAPGATREDSLEQMRDLQRSVEELGAEYEERYGLNPLDFVMAEIGGNSGRGLAGASNKDPDQLGGISIELIDPDLRPYSSFAFVGELQEVVRQHPMAETVSFRGWRSGPGGDAISIHFYGADAQTLKSASETLQQALLQFPEVSAVQDNLAYDKEELVLDLTPQGQALGFTIDGLGRVLRNRLNGIEAATYPDGPRSAAIRVELPDDELTADFLDRMQLRTPAGEYVPLADIVTVQRQSGFSTVRRENGIQLISVTGDLSEDDPARAEEIMQILEDELLPNIAGQYQIEFLLTGLSEQEDEFLNDATLGLMLSLLGIYLTLAWIFSSWSRPAVVMAIIPFGLVGTIWGHYAWDVPLSMFSIVGLIGMTGIIINDSIVLVTTIDEYSKDRGIIPAIIDGACDRLRPVLLTTLTTVLGLSPLLFEQSTQAQFLKPTVITLVYGLGFGMLLVLLVVPALMAMQLDISKQITGLRRALRHPVKSGDVGLVSIVASTSIAILFTMIFLPLFVTGDIWTALPDPGFSNPAISAFVLFISGSAILTLLSFIAASIRIILRQKI